MNIFNRDIPSDAFSFFVLCAFNPLFPAEFKKHVFELFPKFKIVDKQKAKNSIIIISKIIFAILKILGIDLEYSRRTTSQGYTIYLGSDYTDRSFLSQHKLIMHELRHMDQWQRYNILYPITYLLNIWSIIFPVVSIIVRFPVLLSIIISLFIPAGLSLRVLWELQAFKVSLNCIYKAGLPEETDYLINRYTELLTGRNYYFAGSFIRRIIRRSITKHVNKLWGL